jgi:hypothetical protein
VFSQSRLIIALLAARASRDRSALDVLLTVDDLPSGWRKGGETRLRLGFTHNEERDKRARRAKLIGAIRTFVDDESRSQISVLAYPTATEEDARSGVAAVFERRLGFYDLDEQTRDETEVTPPQEAGRHARAKLTSTTGRSGAWRVLTVVWADSGPLRLGIGYRAPAGVDVWELTSTLIQRQRQRLAQAALPAVDAPHS